MRKIPRTEIEPIRLLVDQDNGKVWRTFEGTWLVGSGDIGPYGKTPDGREGWWSVVRAKSGKFMAYVQQTPSDGGRGWLEIFESFEAMESALPARIADMAAKAAGLRAEPVYPEEPLDV